MNLKVLGIDVGTHKLGLGILSLAQGETPSVLLAQTHTIKRQDRVRRIEEAAAIVKSVVKEHKPDLIAIEDFIPFREDDEQPFNHGFDTLRVRAPHRKNISQDAHDVTRLIGRLYEMSQYAPLVECNPMTWPKSLGVVRPRAKDFPRGRCKAWKEACELIVYRIIILQLGLQMSVEEARKQWDFHSRDAIGIALFAGNERMQAERVEMQGSRQGR